jgi:signal transduction histidine kinase
MTAHQKAVWSETTAMVLARIGVLWLLAFLSFLLPADGMAFHIVMGAVFIAAVPYSLWLKDRHQDAPRTWLQFLVDLTLVTGIVYFTGGVQSELTLLYPLVILMAAATGTPRQAAEFTALSITVYALMTTMVTNRIVVEFLPSNFVPHMQSSAALIVLRVIIFGLFGAAGAYVSARCSFSPDSDRLLSENTNRMLNGIPEPALLLNENGLILRANNAACAMLKVDAEEIENLVFSELSTQGEQPIPEHYGRSTHFRIGTRAPLPVAYKTADLILTDSALNSSTENAGSAQKVTLVTFSDLSHPLQLEHQLEQTERITAATRVAGEMAHEIRTPLTAISASVQLLKDYEKKCTAADWLPNSPRRKDRNELFEHIEDASQKMDTVVKNFVDFAEFSPNDLLSIIKLDSNSENQGYIGQLHTIGRGLQDGQNSHSG